MGLLDFEFNPPALTTLDFVDAWFYGPRLVHGEGPDPAIDHQGAALATVVVIDDEIGFPIGRGY